MPYIACDLDALDKAPHVGRAAGVSEDSAIAGLVRMWRYCWAEKTDHVDGVAVRGFFGQDATAALVSFRFLEADTDGFRVRGADRYLRVAKTRSENGKKAASRGNLRRGTEPPTAGALLEGIPSKAPTAPQQGPNSAPALTPSTEHRTLNIKTSTAAAAEVTTKVVVEKSETPKPADFERNPKTGEYALDAWGFWGWHNAERESHQLHDEGRPPDAWKVWFDAALTKVGPDGLSIAYGRFLDDEDFRHRGWPIRVFMSEAVWLPRANPEPERAVRL